ncbi:hypothetical protein SK128_020515, partial [Halocaridina rubra]
AKIPRIYTPVQGANFLRYFTEAHNTVLGAIEKGMSPREVDKVPYTQVDIAKYYKRIHTQSRHN